MSESDYPPPSPLVVPSSSRSRTYAEQKPSDDRLCAAPAHRHHREDGRGIIAPFVNTALAPAPFFTRALAVIAFIRTTFSYYLFNTRYNNIRTVDFPGENNNSKFSRCYTIRSHAPYEFLYSPYVMTTVEKQKKKNSFYYCDDLSL